MMTDSEFLEWVDSAYQVGAMHRSAAECVRKQFEHMKLQVGALEAALKEEMKISESRRVISENAQERAYNMDRLYDELRKLAWACVGEVGMNDTLRPMEEFLRKTEFRQPKAKDIHGMLPIEERCTSRYGAYQCSREKDHCGCHIWYPDPERIEWDSDDESPKTEKRVVSPQKFEHPECCGCEGCVDA